MIRIGLTGGIACGKSTLCTYLKSLGAEIIECDELAHQSIQKNGLNYKSVVGYFGKEILNPDGEINRKRLGEIVFADTAQLENLNQLCHASIRKMWQEKMRECDEVMKRKVVVVEVPLLFEINAQEDFYRTIVLGSSRSVQRERMLKRGYDEASIDKRIDSMWTLEEKMAQPDYVIWNDRDLKTLKQQASAVFNHICLFEEALRTLA